MKAPFQISIRPTKAGWLLILASALFTLILFGSTWSWALEPINKGITRIPRRVFVTSVVIAGLIVFVLGWCTLRLRKIRTFDVHK